MKAEMLTVRDVAAALRISTRQVWKLLASGRLPTCVRLNRSVRWPAQRLNDWMNAGCPPLAEWAGTESNPSREGVV